MKEVAVVEPTTNPASPASEFTESLANGVEVARPRRAVKLLVPEKVFESARRVEEAEVPLDVSTHTTPDEFVLRVPTVEVARVRKPVERLVEEAVEKLEY